jgi:hypothetical protein
MLQTVKIRFNKQNEMTRFFNIPHGDEMRKKKAPVFVFGRRGEPLSGNFPRIQTRNREAFEKWMWKQIEVTIEFENRHPHEVEVLWMHGSRGSSKFHLKPGEKTTHTTMLTHEWWVRDVRVDDFEGSPGKYRLSRQSMVDVRKITSDELYQQFIIEPKECMDLSGHCPFWDGQRECRKNPGFMDQTCPLTCKICKEDGDAFKAGDEF